MVDRKKQLENQSLTATSVIIAFSIPTWHQYTNSEPLHQLRREQREIFNMTKISADDRNFILYACDFLNSFWQIFKQHLYTGSIEKYSDISPAGKMTPGNLVGYASDFIGSKIRENFETEV